MGLPWLSPGSLCQSKMCPSRWIDSVEADTGVRVSLDPWALITSGFDEPPCLY